MFRAPTDKIPKPKDVELEAGQLITLEEINEWRKCSKCGKFYANRNHFHNVEEFSNESDN